MNTTNPALLRSRLLKPLHYLFLFFVLITSSLQAQFSSSMSTGVPVSKNYNFTTFSKPNKGDVKEWKKWNKSADYSHPDFGILVDGAPSENSVEVLSKRKQNERYFVNSKDTSVFYIQKSLGDINYLKDGKWLSLHHKIRPIAPNVYESEFLIEPAGFEIANKRTYVKTPHGKVYFNNWTLWTRKNGKEIQVGKANWSNYTIGDDGMYIKNIFDGIDAELMVFRGAIKTNFIMKKNQYGAFDDLIFRDEFAANSSVSLDFTETPGMKESVGPVLARNQNSLAEINPGVIYAKGGGKNLAQAAAYVITDNKMGIVVPGEWINRLIGQYELVIDPLVTGSNTLAQAAITGSMYNPTCNFVNSCNYNLNVTQPAATTVTDITFSIVYIASGLCYMEDGGLKFVSAGCVSPSTIPTWTCPTPLAGTCTGTNLSMFSDLGACMPTRSCAPQTIPFQFQFLRSCWGNTGCSSTCIGAGSPLTITVHGRTVEIPAGAAGITGPSTACVGVNTTATTPGGQYGVPPYTYNWSFNASGVPSIGTGLNPSINFPTAGTQNLYLTVTDNCGNSSTTSRSVTVNPFRPASVTITANPSGPICPGVPVTFTANAVNGGTPIFQWKKNLANVGTNSPTYVATGLVNGDVITVTLTSSLPCSNSPVTSAQYIVQVATNNNPIPNVAILPAITGQCSVTVTTIPIATNPCTAVVIPATTTNPLVYNTQGTYTITWNYVDGSGNTATQTQQVIVDDTIAPVPNTATLANVTGQCQATVTAPTATDNCGGTITATTSSPLSYTTQGTFPITWTYNDGNGNTTTQAQQVIIDDTIAPVPIIATLPALTGQCSVTVTTIPTATDNCTGNRTATTASPLTYTSSGTITWTYNDGNSNTSTQTQQVIIQDVLAPVPNVAILPTLTGQCSVTVSTTPTATDNCNGPITGTTTNPLTYNASGTITWNYTDTSGNAVTQTQQVIIQDTTAPVPNVGTLPTVTGQCSVTVSTVPTATDNCRGNITGTTTDPLTYTANGTHTITWTYNDGNGNTRTQTQQVVVQSNLPPVPNIATLPQINGQCSVTVTRPTATDPCTSLIITATTANPLTYTTTGTYTINWTYTAANGSTSTQTQQVVLLDTTAPVPTVASLPNITGTCSATVTTTPTATDNCVGLINGTTSNPLTYNSSGTYTIIWSYNDGNGNTVTQNQQVIIQNTSPPVPNVVALPTISQQCGVNITVRPTATDSCGNAITATTSNPLSYNANGTYTIVWTYTDGSGNTATQNQQVVVTDTINPVPNVASLPNLTGVCQVNITTFPTATDNCSGAITATTTSLLNYTVDGTYTVIWTYTDASGNSVTQNQQVIVQDTNAPVVDLATLPTVIGQCSATVTNIPTATDPCVGAINGTTTDPLIYATQGLHTITWTYDDGRGNTTTQTQQVNVQDNLAPVPDLAALPTVTGTCSATVTTTPTATDNCTGSITATTTDPLTYTANGPHTIIWTYTDGNGNTSTQSQQVIVQSNLAPVPDVTSLPQINGQCTVTVATVPTATDPCTSLVINATTTNPLTYSVSGNYTITWTYTAANGSTSTQTQQVVLLDTVLPVPTATNLPTLTDPCSVTVSAIPTATDNCAGLINGTTSNPLTYNTNGTYTIVWTYDDGNGNTITQNQQVIIQNTTPPVPDAATLPSTNQQCSSTITVIPTATDSCGNTITATTTDPLNYNINGSYTITWTYTDSSGNSATQTQQVIVTDTANPIPDTTNLPNLNGSCQVAVTVIPTATDNCSGIIIGTTTDPLVYNADGTYTIVWTFTDASGNAVTQNQQVIVQDLNPPVPDSATLLTVTGQCNAAVTITPTATDACDGVITATTTDLLTYNSPGTYTIIWTYVDGKGNTITQNQQVIVADTIAPIATSQNVTLPLNAAGTAALTAAQVNNASTDNCTIGSIAINKTLFTCADLGANTVILTVTDASGNSSTSNAIITVVDTVLPNIQSQPVTVPLDASGNATITVAQVDNGSTDNCAIVTRTLSKTQFTCTDIGTNTVQYTITDSSGNAASQSVVITITENVPPVAVAVPTLNIALDSNGEAFITVNDIDAGSTDNCAIVSTTISPMQFNCTEVGANTVTLTVTDAAGNTNTATTIVNVLPIPRPTTPAPTQSFCLIDAATVSDLIVDDTQVVWYDNATGTLTLPLNTPLVSGTYYAAKVLGTCIGTDRLAITVIINDVNPPIGSGVEELCRENPTALSQLSISGPNIIWYNQAIGGSPIDESTIVFDGDKYYAAQTDGTCESIQRLEVEIILNYCDVTVYNAVSANNDIKNDYLIIDGISRFPENSIEIFNQWGNKVFETSHYGMNGNNVFKGYANYGLTVTGDTILPFGTYYYVLRFLNRDGIRKEKTGYLHLTH